MISESQYSLFVEHQHTSIICLTRRSIKLVFLAFVLETKFSVLHNCYRYLYQYRRQCWELWADTTDRSAAVCGCSCCLSSGHWLFISSPRSRHRAGRNLAAAPALCTISTTGVSKAKKVWATKWWPKIRETIMFSTIGISRYTSRYTMWSGEMKEC